MPSAHRRKRNRPRGSNNEAAKHKDNDISSIRAINEALQNNEDLSQLRKIAAVRGLVNNQLRSKCWHLLCGVDVASFDMSDYDAWHSTAHRDSGVVAVDVERSLWSFTEGMSDGERQVKRDELRRLLNAVVGRFSSAGSGSSSASASAASLVATGMSDTSPGSTDAVDGPAQPAGSSGEGAGCDSNGRNGATSHAVASEHNRNHNHPEQQQPAQAVHYYQGLHDVAGVLLLVVGERAAFPLLCRIATCHLRDCTRQGLDPVLELLDLLYPILSAADSQLADHLRAAGLPPFFALSWFLTWFAHDVSGLQDAARLFDLFLSSHPLMPLYLGAVAMRAEGERLRGLHEMPDLHSALVNLRLTSPGRSLDQLAAEALQLCRDAPPGVLVQRHRFPLRLSVAPAAQLQGQCWEVPHAPPDAGKPRDDDQDADADNHGDDVDPTSALGRRGAAGSRARAKRRGGGGPLALLSFMRKLAGGGVHASGKRRSLAATAASITGVVGVYLLAAFMSYTLSGGGAGGRGGAPGVAI